ncbi:MAG: hypothetical protein SVK08_01190 [Halobacteriota archaeon]|nr:hypothetical protein [Halobacteriota archaeon]
MKIKATYIKLDSGNIRAILTVTDKWDYPGDIFSYNRVYPSDGGYKLTPVEYKNFIGEDFSTDKEANRWVEDQVDVLRDKLKRWKCTKTSDEHTYSI